jgi:PIF1-like helicase
MWVVVSALGMCVLALEMCCLGHNVVSLWGRTYTTYPGIEQGNNQDQYYLDRTILSCTNDNVDDINSLLLTSFPGPEMIFNSADTVSFREQELNNYQPYPTEYLNSLKASGLPLSRLALKIGCVRGPPDEVYNHLRPSQILATTSR